jgi:SOS-response transcriptional repressor LexA
MLTLQPTDSIKEDGDTLKKIMATEHFVMVKTTGERLKLALNARNCSMADLARALNIKHQVIQYLVSSNAKSSRYFLPISNFLEINLEWLVSGYGRMEKEGGAPSFIERNNAVPIYASEELIKKLNAQNEVFALTPTSYLNTNVITTPDVFGWNIKDQSMFPRFQEKTTVVIDPNVTAKEGCFVLAYVKQAEEIYFRFFSQTSNDQRELIPFNKIAYKAIHLCEQDVILGVMIEARLF